MSQDDLMSVQILSERTIRAVALDGFAVPRVAVQEIAETGQWNVVYDDRFCVLAEDLDELNRWLPLLANVQAVAGGYSCHGKNSVRMPNPHAVEVRFIDGATTGTQEG
jgi:hypothetical protein